MTSSLDIVAGANPVDVRSAARVNVRVRYTVQWQPSNPNSILMLREDHSVPQTGDDAHRLSADQTVLVTTSTQQGMYAWSQGAGKIVITPV